MANILLVGPDRQRATGIRTLLRQDGHDVAWLRAVEGWRARELETLPELVIAVVESTESVLSEPGRLPRGFPAPLLFVRPDADFRDDPFIDERLVDEISSPFLAEELLGRADALVRVRQTLHRETPGPPGTRGGRAIRAGSWARGWRRLTAMLGARMPGDGKPLEPYLEVAARVAEWAERRDVFEPGHAERVTSLCAMMAGALDMGESETGSLLRAAMLHDIGKVALPLDLLRRTEPLEEQHVRMIRTHPRRGASLLKALDRDDEVAATILYHHERPNGEGYYGLGSRDIPKSAHVLAVAEVYDAMTNSRLRPRLSSNEALQRLCEIRGEVHDSDCVDALVDKLRPRTRGIAMSPDPRGVSG